MNCSSLVKDRRGSQTHPICVDSDGEDEETQQPDSPRQLNEPAQSVVNQPKQEDKNAFIKWLLKNSTQYKCGDIMEFDLDLSKMKGCPSVMKGYKDVMGGVTGLSDIDKEHVQTIMEMQRETDEGSESEDPDEEWEFRSRTLSCTIKCSVKTWFLMVGKGDYARLLTDIILRYCLVDLEDRRIECVVSTLGECVERAVFIVENLPESVLEALNMDNSCKAKMIENLYCVLGEATTNYFKDKASRERSIYGHNGRYYKKHLYEYVTHSQCWRKSIMVFGQMHDGMSGECWDYFTCDLHGDAPNPKEEQPFEDRICGLQTKSVRHLLGKRYNALSCSALPSGHYHIRVKYLSNIVRCLQGGDLSKILSATLVVDIHYAFEDVLSNEMSEGYNLYEGNYDQMNDVFIDDTEECSANLNQDELVDVSKWKEEVVFEREY